MNIPTQKPSKAAGFTVVEVIIVIIAIGILASIVIPQFSGVVARSRDVERKADINSLSSQLEYYYGRTGGYPTLSDLNSSTFRTNNKIVTGDQSQTLADPLNKTVVTLVSGTTPNGNYSYSPLPSGCESPTTSTGAQSSTINACRSYTTVARLEELSDTDKDTTLSTATVAYFAKRNAAN